MSSQGGSGYLVSCLLLSWFEDGCKNISVPYVAVVGFSVDSLTISLKEWCAEGGILHP